MAERPPQTRIESTSSDAAALDDFESDFETVDETSDTSEIATRREAVADRLAETAKATIWKEGKIVEETPEVTPTVHASHHDGPFMRGFKIVRGIFGLLFSRFFKSAQSAAKGGFGGKISFGEPKEQGHGGDHGHGGGGGHH